MGAGVVCVGWGSVDFVAGDGPCRAGAGRGASAASRRQSEPPGGVFAHARHVGSRTVVPSAAPARRLPLLEDLGLIGDGATAALVGLDGSVPWLCVPGFDAEPLFCGLLDRTDGGRFGVTPEGVVEARQ